jgi:DNA polymerase-3 subunit alpha
MVATIEQAVSAGQQAAADRASGQGSLFGMPDPAESTPAPAAALAKANSWPESEALVFEKETLGFYVSSHPLDRWAPWLNAFVSTDLPGLRDHPQDRRVLVAAIAQSVRTIVSRNGRNAGRKMAIVTIEDTTTTAEAVLFPDTYDQFAHLLERQEPFFVSGRLDHSRGDPQIIVDRLVPIDGTPKERGKIMVLIRDGVVNGNAETILPQVRDTLQRFANPAATDLVERIPPSTLEIGVETPTSVIVLEPRTLGKIPFTPALVLELSSLLGADSVHYLGGVAVELNKDDRRAKYRKG